MTYTNIRTVRGRGTDDTCCKWIEVMLGSSQIPTTIMEESMTAKVAGGWDQGEVPLWNLMVNELVI